MTPRSVMVLSENWTLRPTPELSTIVELARIAEGCGVDTVMLSEHVVLGQRFGRLRSAKQPA